MSASYANTDAARTQVASQWKAEIREFCQQMQKDLRDAQAAVSGETPKAVPVETVRPVETVQGATEIAQDAPTDDQRETHCGPTPVGPPVVENDLDESDEAEVRSSHSTEDRLRTLREHLNALIDNETT